VSGSEGTTDLLGSHGTTAVAGSEGTTGASGSEGTTGSSGTEGTTAVSGSEGTTGSSGSEGTTNISGSQGTTDYGSNETTTIAVASARCQTENILSEELGVIASDSITETTKGETKVVGYIIQTNGTGWTPSSAFSSLNIDFRVTVEVGLFERDLLKWIEHWHFYV
jgi:hypothetical protein